MPAYVIALIRSISDPDAYKRYVAQVEATLAPFGGRFLARKPDPEALEGADVPSRAIVLEFASEERARAWHASPGYQPVMKLRQSASQGTLLLLPAYAGALVREGEVCFVEHVSSDVEATRRLLESAHGWAFEAPREELGGARVATLASGARVSVRATLHAEERLVTRAYVRVADAARASKRAEETGALVALPPTEIAGQGTIAIFIQGGLEHGVWQMP